MCADTEKPFMCLTPSAVHYCAKLSLVRAFDVQRKDENVLRRLCISTNKSMSTLIFSWFANFMRSLSKGLVSVGFV